MSLRFLTTALVAGLVLSSAPAFAQEEAAPPPRAHFGDAGQFALSLNQGFAVNAVDLFAGGTELQGSVFVAPNLSVGLGIGAQWMSGSTFFTGSRGTQILFRVGPRVGYDIRFSDFVSIWPQVGVDYRRVDSSPEASGSFQPPTATMNAFGFVALAPLVIHPTKGFFIGAGPAFYAELANSTSSGGQSTDNSKVTSLGLMATIGGAI
jgi:hypothetical protein